MPKRKYIYTEGQLFISATEAMRLLTNIATNPELPLEMRLTILQTSEVFTLLETKHKERINAKN